MLKLPARGFVGLLVLASPLAPAAEPALAYTFTGPAARVGRLSGLHPEGM